jgi:hypothetical protein
MIEERAKTEHTAQRWAAGDEQKRNIKHNAGARSQHSGVRSAAAWVTLQCLLVGCFGVHRRTGSLCLMNTATAATRTTEATTVNSV